MNQSYTFYDEAGATISLSVNQILETATQLNYATPHRARARPGMCACVGPDALGSWTRGSSRWRIRSSSAHPAEAIHRGPATGTGRSGRRGTRNTAADRGGVEERFSAMVRDPQAGGSIKLVLDDIRLEQNPAVGYEVYINLPAAGRDTVYTSPHFIGNLGFFTSAHPDRRHLRREFDLVHPYLRLSPCSAGRWTRCG
jgi:hypothetical protein